MTQISGERDRRRQDDENSWEDVSDDEPYHPSEPPSPVSTPSNSFRSATRSGARIRRTATATSPRRFTHTPTRAPRERSFTAGPPPRRPVDIPESNVLGTLLSYVLHYLSDVLGTVFRMLKTPISLILVVAACIYVITLTSGAIRTALAPICSIPIISLACPAPYPIPHSGRVPRRADFPRLLDVQSKNFESLLDETVENPGLALEIKKAEIATSDLATLVRVSNLNSREVLADSLGEFVKDARKVGRGLTRFSSRVGGAVDNIIAVNDYALHAIEAADSRSSALSLSRLLPFTRSGVATKQVITRTFTEAMNTMSTNMQRLVLEAEVSISDLNKLEEHLTTIHEIVSREDSSIAAAKGELLAQLWTILGGNRKELNQMDGHRALLKGVGGYRDRALAHVVAALHMLETMAEDMEELRERVAAPRLVGESIPIHVHMKSLRSGLERLKGRRAGARKLEEEIVKRVLGTKGEANVDSERG